MKLIRILLAAVVLAGCKPAQRETPFGEIVIGGKDAPVRILGDVRHATFKDITITGTGVGSLGRGGAHL